MAAVQLPGAARVQRDAPGFRRADHSAAALGQWWLDHPAEAHSIPVALRITRPVAPRGPDAVSLPDVARRGERRPARRPRTSAGRRARELLAAPDGGALLRTLHAGSAAERLSRR